MPGETLPTIESIQAELEKILASRYFAEAEQLRSFLRFTVAETLAGRAEQIKEYVVAVEVFGREKSFDPRIDPIVRVQAAKLRTRLEKYYASAGSADSLVIEYPKGGYIPRFKAREVIAPPLEHKAVVRTIAPVLAGIVLVALAVWWIGTIKKPPAAHGRTINSLAVLPFVNISGDKDQDYFCDGMTEELINALAKVDGLRVAARTSVSEFKDKAEDIRRIGEKLNVTAVLEGSVRKAGDRLRVTAQLNDVSDGYHLWSETYDRQLSDVFAIQEDIANSIANTVQGKLTSNRHAPLVKRYTADPEVYDLYLKGRHQFNTYRSTREALNVAIRYFEQAAARDPAYAPAYAGLTESYWELSRKSGITPEQAFIKAKRAGLKALELDDGLAEVHVAMTDILWMEWDWPGVEREFKRALEIDPNDAETHIKYSRYLLVMNRPEETVREARKAQELDPVSTRIRIVVGMRFLDLDQFNQAVEELKKTLSTDPKFPAYKWLGVALEGKKMYPQAIDALQKAVMLSDRKDPESLAYLAHALAAAGSRAEALKILHELLQMSKEDYVSPLHIALIYGGLGETEQFFTWLQRAFEERNPEIPVSATNYRFRPFRSGPRFVAILKAMHLQ